MQYKEFIRIAALVIFVVALWQLDILWFIPWNVQVDLPFYLAKSDKYFYRDFLYLCMMLAYGVTLVMSYKGGEE